MILVDTNVLVALVDERDAIHRLASRDLERHYPLGLGVTSPVLAEALFLLPKRYLRQRLALLVDRLRPTPVELEPPWWAEVFSWVDRYADHEPDLADAHLVILATRDPRHKIWTYDREFRDVWRKADGSALSIVGRRLRERRRKSPRLRSKA